MGTLPHCPEVWPSDPTPDRRDRSIAVLACVAGLIALAGGFLAGTLTTPAPSHRCAALSPIVER